MLKQSASGGWSEERSCCIWSSEQRQHEEVTRKSTARLLKRAKKSIISLFSFSFPLNHKMPLKSPLTLACVWQRSGCDMVALSVCCEASVVSIYLDAPSTQNLKFINLSQIEVGLNHFVTDQIFFLLCRWRNVEEPIEYTIDSKVPFSPESSPRSE